MPDNPSDDEDWKAKWKDARNKAIPYGATGIGLEIAALLFFALTSVWYQPVLASLPWWLYILLALVGAPFLVYFFVLAKRSWKLLPDYNFEENTEN